MYRGLPFSMPAPDPALGEEQVCAGGHAGLGRPKLIILDVQLPSMDGLEVCQAIRRQLEHPAGIQLAISSS